MELPPKDPISAVAERFQQIENGPPSLASSDNPTKDYIDSIKAMKNPNEKGQLFEEFCYYYILFHKKEYGVTEAVYSKYASTEVWKRSGVAKPSKIEIGIDLFLLYNQGAILPAQSKNLGRNTLHIGDLSGFLYAMLMSSDGRGKFILMTTCKDVSKDLGALIEEHKVFLINYHSLISNPNLINEIERLKLEHKLVKHELVLKPHQERGLGKVLAEFRLFHKVLIQWCCGLGKTILPIAAADKIGANTILITVPGIELAFQTMEEWMRYNGPDCHYLVVSSGRSRYNMKSTTNPDEIDKFYSEKGRRIIVAVYNSSPKLLNYSFDLLVVDECDQTVGVRSEEHYLILDSQKIRHVISMSATRKTIDNYDAKLHRSMNQEADYGRLVDNINIGKAIEDGLVNEYMIYTGVMTNDIPGLRIYHDKDLGNTVMASAMIRDAIKDGAQKIITVHNSIKHAEEMVILLESVLNDQDVYVAALTSAEDDNDKVDIRKKYKTAKIGILCTVKMLNRGINIVDMDTVAICDPRHDAVELFQLMCRCLRSCPNKPTSRIIIPDDEHFEQLWDVLRSLAENNGIAETAMMEKVISDGTLSLRYYGQKPSGRLLTIQAPPANYEAMVSNIRKRTITWRQFLQRNSSESKLDKAYRFYDQFATKYNCTIYEKEGNKYTTRSSVEEFVKNNEHECKINMEAYHRLLETTFDEQTSVMRERLWSIPDWEWEDNENVWNYIFGKVISVCISTGRLPQEGKMNLWVKKQRDRGSGRRPLNEQQLTEIAKLKVYEFQLNTKKPENDKYREIYKFLCQFTRQQDGSYSDVYTSGISEDHYWEIAGRGNYKTKTPKNSISRDLGKMTGHYVIFISDGHYRIMPGTMNFDENPSYFINGLLNQTDAGLKNRDKYGS